MFGFHSLAPAKLYAGSEKTSAPKSKSVMGDVQSAVSADGHHAATTSPHNGGTSFADPNKPPQSDALTKSLSEEDEQQFHEARDSGVGSSVESHEPESHEQYSVSPAAPEPKQTSQPHHPTEGGFKNSTASIDFTNPQQPSAAEAGPSQPRTGSSHSSLQHEGPLTSAAAPGPDETHFNAIAYRRDPETVIAYLVPLPLPTVQGSPLADATPRYFLYAPPPPHLLKPRHGSSEGYVRKLNRHWQQNVRRAKTNAHNGKRLSARGTHSKLIRGATWGMDKLKYDDVTFLARIHPKTVTHLILIHPWGLAGAQTPEEVMRTFRAQMFESKKRAKRDSIISAVFFLPALVIDTAAIFFGGMAEVDGIWMLVSITAYRTARFITRKMGPEPKTMELEQAKLIEDAKKSGFPPPEPEEEEDTGPGAMRRSVDALRRSLGSVRYRMNMNQIRSRSKRRKGGDTSSTDTSRPQTTEASQGDLGAFSGGELEHHVEEETEGTGTAGVQAAAPPSTAHSGSELSGFLEHMDEEIVEDGQPGASGGIYAGDTDGHRTSADTSHSAKAAKKGQNFQLTFYPSPAMEVLGRYVQESCHMKNGRMYPSPNPVPTEEDVLAVVGWHPERRDHDTPAEQGDDEQWQLREIKDDLRLASRRAAKAWNKTCRKQAKQQRRGKKGGGLLSFRRSVKMPNGKAKETSASDEPQQTEKKARSAAIKARIAAVRSKAQRQKQTPDATAAASPTGAETSDEDATEATQAKKNKRGRAAGAAAILCVPCFAIAKRVKHRRPKENKEPQEPSEKGARREALKQRLSSKRDALRQRKSAAPGVTDADTQGSPAEPVGLETPTDIDEPPTDTEGENAAVATDAQDRTGVEDSAAQPKKKSAKGRLLAIPAAIAAAIAAALNKRRDGKAKKTTASTEPKEKKPSRFSALQERLKARRSRVNKKEPAREKQSRLSGLTKWFQERKQKRKAESVDKTKARKAAKEDKPKDAKERVAVVGLIAGCFAMPIAKAKQVRDKRRKTEPTDSPTVVAGTPLSPVPEEAQQRAVTSGSSTLAPSSAGADRPSTSYQQPVLEEEYEDPPEEVLVAKQYLPGHGQSEVPVRPGPPDARLGSSDTAVEQVATPTEPQQEKSQGAGGKFKAARTGMAAALASRKRATGGESGVAKAQNKGEATEGESAPVGRLQGLKSNLESFKAKRRTADSAQTDAAVENEKSKPTPAPESDNAAAGGRFKSLKEGLANIRAKRTGIEPQASEKVYKDKTPGFIERMRWVWVVA